MILFLIDLYEMENTYVRLVIIKIEPNFWSLFFHESIIKTQICSREQSTSQVHANTFIELKTMKVTKLWDFDKVLRNALWCPQGSLLCTFLLIFFSILSACSITGSVGRSMLSCYHGVQGKDAFYLTPRRPFKYSDDGEF